MKVTDGQCRALQGLFNEASKNKPSKGKTVIIRQGRKHLNKMGVVFWHGKDTFAHQSKDNWVVDGMKQAMGRRGFRIGVKTESGEKFFCPAEYACLGWFND